MGLSPEKNRPLSYIPEGPHGDLQILEMCKHYENSSVSRGSHDQALRSDNDHAWVMSLIVASTSLKSQTPHQVICSLEGDFLDTTRKCFSMCLSMRSYAHMSAGACRGPKKSWISLKQSYSDCELPCLGAENHTPVVRKSSMHSTAEPSPQPLVHFTGTKMTTRSRA